MQKQIASPHAYDVKGESIQNIQEPMSRGLRLTLHIYYRDIIYIKYEIGIKHVANQISFTHFSSKAARERANATGTRFNYGIPQLSTESTVVFLSNCLPTRGIKSEMQNAKSKLYTARVQCAVCTE